MTISLTKLVLENKENRITLMKLTALMEKMVPEMTKAQSKKLTELCTEVHTMVNDLNVLPYTIHNHKEWQVLKLAMMSKLMEVKKEAEKLLESEKVDVKPFIKALDEIIVS
jgi:SpoVK/Ycf46/Vps4 family AAA+-type ATPase